MLEAAKGFRRIKAYKQMPMLEAALEKHRASTVYGFDVDPIANAA